MHSVLDQRAWFQPLTPYACTSSQVRLLPCRCTRHPLATTRPGNGRLLKHRNEDRQGAFVHICRICAQSWALSIQASSAGIGTSSTNRKQARAKPREEPRDAPRPYVCSAHYVQAGRAVLGAWPQGSSQRRLPKPGVSALNAGGSAGHECGSKVNAIASTQPQTNHEAQKSVHDVCLFSGRTAPGPTCTSYSVI